MWAQSISGPMTTGFAVNIQLCDLLYGDLCKATLEIGDKRPSVSGLVTLV